MSLSMAGGYPDDCVIHAVRIARLLLEDGLSPWIGKVTREEITPNGDVIRWPLIPKRLAGRAWTTHYVACAGSDAYDPIAGEPVAIDRYANEVFGIDAMVETHLDAAATKERIVSGEIRRSFGKAVYREDQLDGQLFRDPAGR